MNVYVETNFVLELAFVQEQRESCERLMALCENGRVSLVLPAFCIAESYEKLIRQARKRSEMNSGLERELRELGPSEPYKDEINALNSSITGLVVRSNQEEDRRVMDVVEQILRIASVIPLDAAIIRQAAAYRTATKLSPQDSIVYASVLQHLASVGGNEGCFITKDLDFGDPEIKDRLESLGCKMLFKFTDGCNYVAHVVDAQSHD